MSFLSHRPARGNLNQGFGPRPKPTPTSPATHYGQDYGWGGGDAIYAAADGVIVGYASSGAYGRRVIVAHGNGVETWYCHTTSLAPGISVGQEVKAGQYIAVMGSTGNVTGKHLHFELRINGIAVDPEPYFGGAMPAGFDHTDIEEDDMYTELDRYRDNIVLEAAGRMELKLYDIRQVLGAMQAVLDINKWALVDETGGLRHMVAKVQTMILGLASNDDADAIDIGELRQALGEFAPAAPDAIAGAITAREVQIGEVAEAVLDGLSTRQDVSAADVATEILRCVGELADAAPGQG